MIDLDKEFQGSSLNLKFNTMHIWTPPVTALQYKIEMIT